MRQLAGALLMVAALALTAIPGSALTGRPAPDFTGGGPWFNTDKPLTLAGLRGRVVVVDMWAAGCINCIHTLPYVKHWDAAYRAQGLVVVGVHSPEFDHERAVAYVKDAVAREAIKYPVVMDNDFRIWKAYGNEYWPTLYLIDKRGNIRYTHIGEGAYDATEQMIRTLLAEPG